MANNSPDATGFSPVPRIDNNSYFDLPPGNYNASPNGSAPTLVAQRPAYDNSGLQNTNMQMSIPAQPSQAAPMPQFGGENSPAQYASPGSIGFGGVTPSNFSQPSNPYLQGMPNIMSDQPYDPVQVISNLQRAQTVAVTHALAAARQRDHSPIAYLNRFAAGFSGRPVVTNQQRVAQAIAATQPINKDAQEAMLQALAQNQGSYADRAKAQEALANSYNNGLNNFMQYGQQMRGHDVADANGQRTYDANMYGHQVTDRGNALNYLNNRYGHDIAAQHNANTDAIANINQQYQQMNGNRQYDLQAQQQRFNQNQAQSAQEFQRQNLQNEPLIGKDGKPVMDKNGNIVTKYYTPSIQPRQQSPDPLTAIGNFLFGQRSAAQAQIPQPSKPGMQLDVVTARRFLNLAGGDKAKAMQMASQSGWRY
ncbi:MAG TPA: hypothetical protein V6C86_21025 [Oculatellaceae cyanobacterium]